MAEQTDDELVQQARHDPAAFAMLYDRYYQAILGYSLRRVGHVETAQDITADTFYKALDKLWQFQWRSVPFSAWLYRIASNLITDHYRSHGKRVTITLDDAPEVVDPTDLRAELVTAEAELERHQDYLKLQQALKLLPPHYQTVLSLRFFEQKSLADISLITGKKLGTVKSLLHRGLKQLKTSLI